MGWMLAIPFPPLDPIAFSLGPLPVRWYGLAYFFGVIGVWQYALAVRKFFPAFSKKDADDFLIWVLIGVVVGGRLGYVLFYRPDFFWAHPGAIFQTWQGGMAFHGGVIGVGLAFWLYCRRRKLPLLSFSDWACCGIPLALFFGRLANFVNQELYGRVTSVSWGVIFPSGGPLPRHPSQLYEAFLEGLVLLMILRLCVSRPAIVQKPGVLTGIFLVGYSVFRIFVECFREPDAYLGFFAGNLTMGQLLSFPLLLLGLFLILWKAIYSQHDHRLSP